VDGLARRFEARRGRLTGLAYRMLGSRSEAEDAVQEAWLHLSRAADGVGNLDPWLSTVVGRICLDMLRSRRARRERPLDGSVPDPVVETDPEYEAVLADSIGLALLVVLDTLTPAERVAFVLHDLFAMPFEEVAQVLDRSPAATRQLASRARRRVRADAVTPDADLARQRQVVDAFFAAARAGDFEALLTVLDPQVTLRADFGAAVRLVRGAHAVADGALGFAWRAELARPVLVNGAAGAVVLQDGRPLVVLGFTVSGGRIVEIDILGDPARLRPLPIA
jgi:RNA polymerase sigma factor (sigma-70 family)